jgi:hypothetical protein
VKSFINNDKFVIEKVPTFGGKWEVWCIVIYSLLPLLQEISDSESKTALRRSSEPCEMFRSWMIMFQNTELGKS